MQKNLPLIQFLLILTVELHKRKIAQQQKQPMYTLPCLQDWSPGPFVTKLFKKTAEASQLVFQEVARDLPVYVYFPPEKRGSYFGVALV